MIDGEVELRDTYTAVSGTFARSAPAASSSPTPSRGRTARKAT